MSNKYNEWYMSNVKCQISNYDLHMSNNKCQMSKSAWQTTNNKSVVTCDK